MHFEALYYPDRLQVINATGDVAIATLWSRVEQVNKVLTELGIDLNPSSSRIAVIANLYGNGLPHMLRNLLWNPQIVHIIALGQNLSGSREDLVNFFAHGLKEDAFLGVPVHRINGTDRVIDGLVTPAHFRNGVRIYPLETLSNPTTRQGLVDFFLDPPPPQNGEWERINIPLPEISVQRYPSEPRNHSILRDTPLDAFEELIFRLVRFGHRNRLKKGERIELQNVKVIVERPQEEAGEHLAAYGFSLEAFRRYQQNILSADKPADISYTYGNRLRGYFRHDGTLVDSLEIAVKRLREDPETRHAYAALWDNNRDLPEGHGCPCLVSVFFRRFDGKLTLTTTFRTHNARSAWLENFYGLMAIQRFVAERVDMEPGPITVFSHSISIDSGVLAEARTIAENKQTDDVVDRATGKRELRFDYNGDFTITIDRERQEIVVQHSFDGMAIAEYRDRRADGLERQLARDGAISEIGHALFLGREIARAEMQLKQLQRKDKDK
ncbi:MAG: hypothetical protein H6971_08400 [Gammaproteobacteria bacterium]|nr:hypothetical protein [Gammaproteobacteria bacterium]